MGPHKHGDKQHRHALLAQERRKDRELEEAQKAEMERANEAREKEQQQRAKNRRNEEDADSSLQMLEMLTKQRRPSPPRQRPSFRNHKRGLSRSRSISAQRSPVPQHRRRRLSYEEALQQRLDARDKA